MVGQNYRLIIMINKLVNYKISVIITIRNSDKTLTKCLMSVLSQNYKNYEIILVDNGSTDKTRKIAEEFAVNDCRIKYFFVPKIGRGIARNYGILESTGEIIAMIDADCIAPPDWLKNLIKPIIEDDETIVMGGESDLIGNYWTKNIQKSNEQFIQKNSSKKYINIIDTKNFAIEHKVMGELMFDENLINFEDFDLYLRLSQKYSVLFLPQIKVGHYHQNSFISTITKNVNRGYWTIKIYQKHQKDKNIIRHPMFESISIINFIKLPIWLIWRIAKNPGEALFIITSEISWRIGILGGLIK